MPAFNALLLGSLMYRSRLVPRIIPVLGLIGAPFLICTVIATLFGGIKLGSPELAAVPVAAWELSLGVWLVVKGFRPSPITAAMDAASTPRRLPGRRGLTPGTHDTAGPSPGPGRVRLSPRSAMPLAACAVRAHRTRRTGRIVTAPMIAHSPATMYSTP